MKYIVTIFFFLGGFSVSAQKFSLEKSTIMFFSDAAIEDIKADNQKASAIFNSENGEIVFSIPIQEFQFDKALMKEHFNEKYMESDKFPKATFQGKISDFDRTKTESQNANAIGKLTIHGVTNDVQIPGTIEKQGDKYVMKSKFIVKLVDYKITIPQLLWQNIAEQVEVTSDFAFKPQ
jgi:polyisoprenoid-binding protein YceI